MLVAVEPVHLLADAKPGNGILVGDAGASEFCLDIHSV